MNSSPWRRALQSNVPAGRLGYLALGGVMLWWSAVLAQRVAVGALVAAVVLLAALAAWRRIGRGGVWPALVTAGLVGGGIGAVLEGTELRPPGPTLTADVLSMLGSAAGDALPVGAFLVGGGIGCLLMAFGVIPRPLQGKPAAPTPLAGWARVAASLRQLGRAVLVLGITLLAVGVLVGSLVTLTYGERGHQGLPARARRFMRSTLRDLAYRENEYYAANQTFTRESADLTDLDWADQDLKVTIEQADAHGWRARAIHRWVTTSCTIAADAPQSGQARRPEPVCHEDRHWLGRAHDTPPEVTVTPSDYTVLVGDTLRFASWAAQPDDPWSTVPATLEWQSSNPTAAVVDERGLVRAVAPGRAMIRARAGGVRGEPADSARLTVVASFARIRSLSAGKNACALTVDGVTYCWRTDLVGEPGEGAAPRPARVPGAQRFTSLSAGAYHTCGIARPGTVYCWGSSYRGQLGDGAMRGGTRGPVPVGGGLSAAFVAGGLGHTCALDRAGRAYCWGSNQSYQLGRDLPGGAEASGTPAPVETDLRFSTLAAGGDFTCGLDRAGTAYCWGSNTMGELGGARASDPCPHTGDEACGRNPVPVLGALRLRAITAGNSHACGLALDGVAYCWGDNRLGAEKGTRSVRDIPRGPVPVPGHHRFIALTAGFFHTCGLESDGAAFCWGEGWRGQLGNGSKGDRSIPVPVAGGLRFAMLAAGDATCGLSTNRRVYCWGYNVYGRRGVQNYSDHQPAPVAGPEAGAANGGKGR